MKEELISLVKLALPTKQEVFERQNGLRCFDMTRCSVYGFNKIVEDVAARYSEAHEVDKAELQRAIAEIKSRFQTLTQWEDSGSTLGAA
ncbi:MAG: hypothetical protein E3J66_00945 [Dehalococcoidia bacterium]|nr:MAG: hypothetical protein E3J66_00945 [Dehalococcoidia bacterium]